MRAAEFVSACVRGNADMLRALAGPTARVEWIYHGVDLRRFDGRGRARADPEPLLMCVGRLAPPKGFDTAIRALGALKSRGLAPRLIVVGDGPSAPRLEALARTEGVADRVTFAGALTHGALLPPLSEDLDAGRPGAWCSRAAAVMGFPTSWSRPWRWAWHAWGRARPGSRK